MPQELSERRAADRHEMARQVAALAIRYGCHAEIKQSEGVRAPQRVIASIRAPGGLQVAPDFDGTSSQPDVHVLSWHMALDSDAKIDPDAFGGMVNEYHFRKATYVARGFADLMRQLEAGLAMCADGSAYQRESAAQPR